MNLKALALILVVLLAVNAKNHQRHQLHTEVDGGENEGSSWDWDDDDLTNDEEDSVEDGDDEEGEGEESFGPTLSAESQAKITQFMLNDDGIRAELIANTVAETPELSWLSEISAENQKAVLRIFMKYSEQAETEADPSALIAELNEIDEVQPHIAAWVGEEAHHNRVIRHLGYRYTSAPAPAPR